MSQAQVNIVGQNQSTQIQHRALVWMLTVFLLLEYARPPVIVDFKLQLLIILALAAAVLGAKDRPWSKLLTAQVLFFAIIAKSLPFASNNYGVFSTMRGMFGHVVIACAIAWLMSWPPNFRRIAWVWVLTIGYCAVYAVTHAGRGPGGPVADENDLALTCLVALPFALNGFDYLRGWQKWAAAGLGGVLMAGIVASLSRGGFVGLAAVIAYYLFSAPNKGRRFLLVIVGMVMFLAVVPTRYLHEVATIEQDTQLEDIQHDSTGRQRLFLWATAFNMWKAHPIMGIGAGNFDFQAGDYQPTSGFWPPYYYERDWSGTTTHSLYFLTLAELGTPGAFLIAYITWNFFRLLSSIKRRERTETDLPEDLRRDMRFYAAALGGGMVGYLAAAAFLSTTYYPHFWYMVGMAVALDVAVRRGQEHRVVPNSTSGVAEPVGPQSS